MRAGSYLPTPRGTSSASLRTAAPDRRPHTAPDLPPVAYPGSREHDEELPLRPLVAQPSSYPMCVGGDVMSADTGVAVPPITDAGGWPAGGCSTGAALT